VNFDFSEEHKKLRDEYYRWAKLHALTLGSAHEWKRRLMAELPLSRWAARRSGPI
jgi:hypothetical protein